MGLSESFKNIFQMDFKTLRRSLTVNVYERFYFTGSPASGLLVGAFVFIFGILM